MSSYPVAYRAGALAYADAGFQGVGVSRPEGPAYRLPRTSALRRYARAGNTNNPWLYETPQARPLGDQPKAARPAQVARPYTASYARTPPLLRAMFRAAPYAYLASTIWDLWSAYRWPMVGQSNVLEKNGWWVEHDCGPMPNSGPPTHYAFWSSGYVDATTCLTGQAAGNYNSVPIEEAGLSSPYGVRPHPNSISMRETHIYYNIFNIPRHTILRTWYRPAADAGLNRFPRIRSNPVPVAPSPAPMPHYVHPARLPIHQFVPVSRPLPWRLMPALNPVGAGVPPFRSLRGNSVPRVSPRANRATYSGPDIVLGPRGIGFGPPTHRFKPPPVRTKEKKFRKGAGAPILRPMGSVTEALDLLDALFESLPDELMRGRDPVSKLAAVVKGWDRIDWDFFLFKFMEMQVEDTIFGRLGSLTQKGQQAAFDAGLIPGGSPVGYQTGGWAYRSASRGNSWREVMQGGSYSGKGVDGTYKGGMVEALYDAFGIEMPTKRKGL